MSSGRREIEPTYGPGLVLLTFRLLWEGAGLGEEGERVLLVGSWLLCDEEMAPGACKNLSQKSLDNTEPKF